jgi:hypothetical protein
MAPPINPSETLGQDIWATDFFHPTLDFSGTLIDLAQNFKKGQKDEPFT